MNDPTGWETVKEVGEDGRGAPQINFGGNRGSDAASLSYLLARRESPYWGNYFWHHGWTKRNDGTHQSGSPAGTIANPYKATTKQSIENLPDGRYAMYAWVKSSGGQNEAYLYIDVDGVKAKADINTTISEWTLVVVSKDIHITGGSAEVGFYRDAAADQWIRVDDFALIRVDETMTDGKGQVSLAGNTAIRGDDDAEYVLSAANTDKLSTVTAWFEVKGDYFSGKAVEGLNGFEVLGDIAWEFKGGSLWSGRATLANMTGGVTSGF